MKRRITYTTLVILFVISCSPYFLLPDQNLKFSSDQKIGYSFKDTIRYSDNSNQFINYKIARFYSGTIGHTLTGTDYKGAQAYCDYELLTFCKIEEQHSCDSIYKKDIFLLKNIYTYTHFGLDSYIIECDNCFSVVKYMDGDREKEKKLIALFYWRNKYLIVLNVVDKISEIKINGNLYSNVYKTDVNNYNITSLYYSNEYGIIKIEFIDGTFLQKN